MPLSQELNSTPLQDRSTRFGSAVSDLGNISEIANSLVPSHTLNQARTTGTFQSMGGSMPPQKTREELEDRIDELEAELKLRKTKN